MHYLCKSLCYAFLNRKLNVSVHHASHHTVPSRLQTYNFFGLFGLFFVEALHCCNKLHFWQLGLSELSWLKKNWQIASELPSWLFDRLD